MQRVKYTPEQLEIKIVEYFEYVDEINKQRKFKRFEGEKQKPYTISGLCVYLDICRDTWADYSKKSEYDDPIKRAKSKVENYVEEGLLNGALSTIGSIFNLKNNFGWVDKFDVNTTVQAEQLSPDDIRQQLNSRRVKEINGNNVESIRLIEDIGK